MMLRVLRQNSFPEFRRQEIQTWPRNIAGCVILLIQVLLPDSNGSNCRPKYFFKNFQVHFTVDVAFESHNRKTLSIDNASPRHTPVSCSLGIFCQHMRVHWGPNIAGTFRVEFCSKYSSDYCMFCSLVKV